MARQERRRAVSALITILFSIGILVAPLVAMAIAQGAPNITLWNPSDYSAGAQETPLMISDAPTGDDEAEGVNENTYRLMATTQNTPANPLVEFEIESTAPVGAIPITVGSATQVGADAWEFHWDVPASVTDGNYRVRAILYSGLGEVDRHERTVLVRTGNTAQPPMGPDPDPPAPAADITYPANGAQVGFYVNPATGTTNTIVRAEYSEGTTYIEAFYTVSDPGDEPVWKSCDGPANVGTSDFAPPGSIEFRCVLESADQGGQSVTGLGVVSNNTPTEDPFFGGVHDPNFNTAGDSIRTLPYVQDAASLLIEQATVRYDGPMNHNACSPPQFIVVLDQLGNPIADMNVDVHARGPSDGLKFRVPGTPLVTSAPSPVKPPDKAHSSTERGWACNDPSESRQTSTGTRQGDHNVPQGSDIKHIESSGNTTNAGRFGIAMKSDVNGETQLVFWADEDGDDQFCDDEPFVNGGIGFNVPAPVPAGETATITDCPIPAPPPPGGTETTTGVSPTDTGGGPECTHEGTEGDDQITGTQGNDVICAGAGDDTVDGRGGDDIIRGEEGDDFIDGDIGDDTIDGDTGNDRLEGGAENDLIDGFTGIDVLVGGEGNDTLRGGAAVDGLQGGLGDDVVQAGSGDDIGDGQAGVDILSGFKGEDILRGGAQNDTIKGKAHSDQLTGGNGNDSINGGGGRDQCSGGRGRDKVRKCEK